MGVLGCFGVSKNANMFPAHLALDHPDVPIEDGRHGWSPSSKENFVARGAIGRRVEGAPALAVAGDPLVLAEGRGCRCG